MNMQIKVGVGWDVGLVFMCNFIVVKPGLHIVVTIAEHACDRVPKRLLMLSSYRLQIFLMKYEYLTIITTMRSPRHLRKA